ncbi:MAG TPA: alpha/beta hydrolase [Miltoncostaeaceae bacterium]|nr:alpha/beta hydrolase [Miltoncostaeaceae bacterium]
MPAVERLSIDRPGLVLDGESAGDGSPVLLLHGLSATRRYVLHGSTALERSDRRVVGFDARGHGESDPAPDPAAYRYADMADDAIAVLDAAGIDRAALVGQSMGAATAVRVALEHPERVGALVLVTPAHLGRPSEDLDRWDALADGLLHGGPEGFLAAYGTPRAPERWVPTIRSVILQRLARHRHPAAVADALRAVPRSTAFDGMAALEGVAAPTLVVGSRDDVDSEHPLAVAERYRELIPGAGFVVEKPGEAPLAWRGAALSAAVADFLDEAEAG